jgi:hypothetical protein
LIELVNREFARFVVQLDHVTLLLCLGRDHPLFNLWSQVYAVSFICDVTRVTFENRALLISNWATNHEQASTQSGVLAELGHSLIPEPRATAPRHPCDEQAMRCWTGR